MLTFMRKLSLLMFALLATAIIVAFASRHQTVQAQGQPGAGFAAIPGAKGGQDTFGAYEVVKGWPKNISTIPGNENWTWGAAESVYAESPNRVFMLVRGELPNIK